MVTRLMGSILSSSLNFTTSDTEVVDTACPALLFCSLVVFCPRYKLPRRLIRLPFLADSFFQS